MSCNDATGTFETLTFVSCCREPNHITWVFVRFSRSRLTFNHASMSTRHAVRRRTAASASPAAVCRCKPACHLHRTYWCRLSPWRSTTGASSAVCTERTTAGPVRILVEPQTVPSAQKTVYRQSGSFCRVRNDRTQSKSESVSPTADRRRSSSIFVLSWLSVGYSK